MVVCCCECVLTLLLCPHACTALHGCRRAYYVMAKRMHPDKCQGADAVGAKERFQRICEAYQARGAPLRTLVARARRTCACSPPCMAVCATGKGVAERCGNQLRQNAACTICGGAALCTCNSMHCASHVQEQGLRLARQVLGNAELRERYDAGGQKALDINFMEVRASACAPWI